VDVEKSGSSGIGSIPPSATVRKSALQAPVERKKKILAKHEKSMKKPGDVIPFGQDEKESFKDF
jgi:hypothetical protein